MVENVEKSLVIVLFWGKERMFYFNVGGKLLLAERNSA
jgi:hypothetical protein